MKNVSAGQIYWATTKSEIAHPHLIIEMNEGLVTVCQITTNHKKADLPGNVSLSKGEGGLQKSSIVDVSKVFKIEHDHLGDYIGQVRNERVQQVLSGAKFLQKTYFDS